MTQAARKVLQDCRTVLGKFKNDALYINHHINWITALVLLRTVGHVLSKVDSKQSFDMKHAIDSSWENLNRTKPEPKIFWQFIEEGRNNILKEYDLGQQSIVMMEAPLYDSETGERVSFLDREPKPTSYHYLVRFGAYNGRSQKEIVGMAIDWWGQYLDDIDAQVAALNNA